MSPMQLLRHHVTGAIERGDATAIVGIPADASTVHPVMARERLTDDARDLFTDTLVAHRQAYRDFLALQRTDSARRLAQLAWG